MAGRPPAKATTQQIATEANKPIFGSTPATREKAIASGTTPRATTTPAKISFGREVRGGKNPAKK